MQRSGKHSAANYINLMSQEQLQRILAYTNENVISRFTDQFAVNETEAEDIFTETKKFLFLLQQPGIFIPDELLMLDEMWHNFILFTKDYDAFCQHFFGKYLHHLPASRQEKAANKKLETENPAQLQQAFEQKLSYLVSQVFDYLGADTVVKWFQVYPIQYSKPNITSLRKY